MKRNIPVKTIFVFSFVLVVLSSFTLPLLAGSRASYTRGGWVGSKYPAMGMAAEVTADDVYSIYWNPAGLAELRGAKRISPGDIRSRASEGKIDDLTEDDLLRFYDDDKDRFAMHVGASAAMLQHDRNAGFAGVAFDAFNGVFGVGLYTIGVTGIEGYDDQGDPAGDLSYVASAGHFSYGWSSGAANMGVTVKGLYERIDSTVYAGAGADVGAQVSVLPFFKIGFVAQDLGAFLKPVSDDAGVDKEYDFASPSLRMGASLLSDAGLILAFGITKRFEQDNFLFSFGMDYRMYKNMHIYAGVRDGNLSGGISIALKNINIGYALAVDRIDYGYNNIVSVDMQF